MEFDFLYFTSSLALIIPFRRTRTTNTLENMKMSTNVSLATYHGFSQKVVARFLYYFQESRQSLFSLAGFFCVLEANCVSLTILHCSVSLEGCLAFNSQLAAPNLDRTCGHRCAGTKRLVVEQNAVSKITRFSLETWGKAKQAYESEQSPVAGRQFSR